MLPEQTLPDAKKPADQEDLTAERGSKHSLLFLVLGLFLLGLMCVGSLLVGARMLTPLHLWQALQGEARDTTEQIILLDYRLPRTLLAVLCGAAFGVSGALIQAATRNPLADPGILGVNAGAAFFVTLAVGLLGWQSIDTYIWAAFAGAIVVTGIVYLLGALSGAGGATPVRLVLAGVALSAMLGGIGSALALLNPQTFDALRMWSIGSVAGRNMHVLLSVLPFILAGLLIACLIAPALNAVALGDDLARSLGTHILRTRLWVVLAVTLLAGAGTAAVGDWFYRSDGAAYGAVVYLGDQRRIIGFTMIFAPLLLLSADIAGRLVLFPSELEAGIVTAFIGAPVLIILAQRRQVSGL